MCKNCKRLRSAAFAAIRTVIKPKPVDQESTDTGIQDTKPDGATQQQ